MSRKSVPLPAAYRWSVASRVMAAALGGYALTFAATVLLWPIPRAQAVLAATMLSFTLYTIAVIWVYSTRSAGRAWAGMLLGTALTAGAAWLLMAGCKE
ncbi:DUF3649 domain-containing protein [Thauera sp. SDU_THAU2]|uniref:DUF3649 domain-containing protein n=1 Tax=Thauera sp. SDU_THAU2 TaxID=3136633 RepID=UPI00311EFAC4